MDHGSDHTRGAPRGRRGAFAAAVLLMVGVPAGALLFTPGAGAQGSGGGLIPTPTDLVPGTRPPASGAPARFGTGVSAPTLPAGPATTTTEPPAGPGGAAAPAAPGGPNAPGADLAGINTSATASGIEVEPLTPGIVGAGDTSTGGVVQVTVPYASSTSTTGPATAGAASPVYPGPTAAAAGTAIETFEPSFPTQLADMLNDPVLAQADYPPQVGVGSSGSYAPPGGSTSGAGTASTQAGPAGTTATSSVNDTSLPGGSGNDTSLRGGSGNDTALPAGAPMIEIASATSTTTATVGAASVGTVAHSTVGEVKLLGGTIQIAGISSGATASSNGSDGQQSSALDIGAVTVAGVAAHIGPDGIQLDKTSVANPLVGVANQALQALQQAGVTVTALAPTSTVDGGMASVTSGAVRISMVDTHVPNPQGQLPVGNSVGLEVNLAQSEASAEATALPPFAPFPSFGSVPAGLPPIGSAGSGGTGSGPVSGVVGVGPVATGGASGGTGTGGAGPELATAGSAPTGAPGTGPAAPSAAQPFTAQPIGFLGRPIRVGWLVGAFLLSLIGAGPLLAYANWQLLRGRSS